MIAVYLQGVYRCACIVCCKSITYGEGFQNAIVDINNITIQSQSDTRGLYDHFP